VKSTTTFLEIFMSSSNGYTLRNYVDAARAVGRRKGRNLKVGTGRGEIDPKILDMHKRVMGDEGERYALRVLIFNSMTQTGAREYMAGKERLDRLTR
jgi:hypothetical protein